MSRVYYSLFILFCMSAKVRPEQNEFIPSQKDQDLSSLFFSKIDGLFSKYSTDRQSMNATQMDKFLDHLIELLSNDQKKHKLFHNENADHGHHEHDHDHDHEHGHSHDEHKHDEKIECLIEKFNEIKKVTFAKLPDHTLDKGNFYKLTGVIMADIDYCFCNTTNLTTLNKYSILDKKTQENWIYAFLSAFLISVIGLLCYLIVPSVNTYCFNNLFQFLVALAVGTLSGDSLLHLIPHAFMGHENGANDSHDHSEGVYKGLGAVVGIYVFFLIERIMQIRRARKEKRHRMNELDANSDKFIHKDKMGESDKNLGQNVPAANVNTNLREKNEDKTLEEPLFGKTNDNSNAYAINFENSTDPACLVIHANKDLKYISQYLPNNPCDVNVDHHDSENERQHLHKHRNEPKKYDVTEGKVLKHSHSHSHKHGHGHSHKHHIYKSPREKAHHDHHIKHEKELTDIKLIAWMVLMGDGLHNFADGLAIGVSFGSSLTTGFGTAIAVLCHELPHEIGDFAVLRRAGVSLRKALFFNAISGILCMFGVLVGLLIGGFDFFKNWSFLFIAGTFLYISLVDMIPELSENKEDDSISNFLIQSFGILFGVGIMFAIAVFEENIVNLFKNK